MGKVDEALDHISQVESMVERALLLGALSSSLLKIKHISPVLVGKTAYECYTDEEEGNPGLLLAVQGTKPAQRTLQEVFRSQLLGTGGVDEWEVLGVSVRLQGGFISNLPELCRDFQTDFGIAKLAPAEELTAERILASFFPDENPSARYEAKMLLAQALNEKFVMDWAELQKLCDTPAYRCGEQLAVLRAEAKYELDLALAQPSPENESGDSGLGQENDN